MGHYEKSNLFIIFLTLSHILSVGNALHTSTVSLQRAPVFFCKNAHCWLQTKTSKPTLDFSRNYRKHVLCHFTIRLYLMRVFTPSAPPPPSLRTSRSRLPTLFGHRPHTSSLSSVITLSSPCLCRSSHSRLPALFGGTLSAPCPALSSQSLLLARLELHSLCSMPSLDFTLFSLRSL